MGGEGRGGEGRGGGGHAHFLDFKKIVSLKWWVGGGGGGLFERELLD